MAINDVIGQIIKTRQEAVKKPAVTVAPVNKQLPITFNQFKATGQKIPASVATLPVATKPAVVSKPVWNESKVQLKPAEQTALANRNLEATKRLVSNKPGAFAYGVAKGAVAPGESLQRLAGVQETADEKAVRMIAETNKFTAQMDASKGMGAPNIIKGQEVSAYGAGKMVGSVLPFVGVESVAGAGLAKLAPKLTGLALTGTKGAISGGGILGLEAAVEGKRGKELLGATVGGALMGAGGNVAFGYIGKALQKIKAGTPVAEAVAEVSNATPEVQASIASLIDTPEVQGIIKAEGLDPAIIRAQLKATQPQQTAPKIVTEPVKPNPFKEKDVDYFVDEVAADAQDVRRVNYLNDLVSKSESMQLKQNGSKDGDFVIYHPSTKGNDGYQLSYFKNGEPVSDAQFGTKTELIERLHSDGYGIEVKSPETWASLDVNTQTPRPSEFELYVPGVTPEPVMGVRQTIQNSAMNSAMVPDAEKAVFGEGIEQGAYNYQRKSNLKDYTNAQEFVEKDFDSAMNQFKELENLKGSDDTALGIALASKAYNNGNVQAGHDVIEHLAKLGTSAGQAVQAISIMKRLSPEGMLYFTEGRIKNAVKAIKKVAPDLINKVEQDTKAITDGFKNIDKTVAGGVIDDVIKTFDEPIKTETTSPATGTQPAIKNEKLPKVEKTPAERLAQRIINTQTEKTPAERDLVKQMINELFGVAKESPIVPRIAEVTDGPIQNVAASIKARQQYVNTWKEAKDIVMSNFKNADDDVKLALEAYFEKGIKPPYSSKTFNSALSKGMKELDINITDIAKKYYSTGRQDVESLKQYLVRESGLTGKEAEYLSGRIEKRVHALAKTEKEKLARKMFGNVPKAEKAKKTAADEIETASNLGLFVNETYKDKIIEKLTPSIKKALIESGVTLNDLVRLGADSQTDARQLLGLDIINNIDVSLEQKKLILKAAKETFDSLANDKKQKILKAMFVTRKKPVVKSPSQKIYELINLGAYDENAIKKSVMEKYGLPDFTIADKNFIVSNTQKAAMMPDGEAKDILIGQINQLIADKIPATLGEKIAAGLRVSMLLNPKTLVTRNPVGNVVFGTLENLKQLPATGADIALSKLTGKRTTALPNIAEQGKGFVQGVKATTNDIKYEIDTAMGRGGVELPHSRKIFDDNTPVGKALNTAHNWMGNALKYGDRPFYEAAKQSRLAELKKLGTKSKMTPDEIEAAGIEEGLSRTFQNRGEAVKRIESIKKGLGPTLGQSVMPFVSTPANVIAKGLEYTPLGIVKLLKDAVIDPKLLKGFDQKSFVDTLGRTMTGTAIATAGYNLAKNGLATGKASTDKDASALQKEMGLNNYAINVGDKSVTFDWMQPAAIPLAIGVDFYNAGKTEKDLADALSSGIVSGGNTLLNMSVLNGMNQMFRGYSASEGIAKSVLSTPLQALPTLGSQMAAYADPYQRQYEQGIAGGIKSKAMAKVPGLRQQMPVKTGITGEPLKQFQGRGGIGRILEAFVLPYNYSEVSNDTTLKEIKRVYDSTGVSGVIPSVAPKSFTVNKQDIVLTPELQSELQSLSGKTAMARIKDVVNATGWKAYSDKKKADAMKKIVDDSMDSAKVKLLRKYPELIPSKK